MNKYQAKYEVTFSYGEEVVFSVIVINEEGMNEDEIVLEAQVTLQKEGIQFDAEKIELVSCLLVK
jgi:hypothetical protein